VLEKRVIYIIHFFFSSRRRHTRCLSDWSSDVCSSDLVTIAVELYTATASSAGLELHQIDKKTGKRIRYLKVVPGKGEVPNKDIRSEERRVGKECRWQRSAQV